MNKLLYIKASPMGALSYSTTVADEFIAEYIKTNPEVSVEKVDVFKDDLPEFNFEAASAKYKIMHGKEHTEKDKEIWNRILGVIEQFKSADIYVFAVPMWNFSIPYRLKQYLDIIIQPGQTFGLKDDGHYMELVKSKKVFVAYARSGEYPKGSEREAMDMQTKYFNFILGFLGFTDITSVIIEPTIYGGKELAQERKKAAIEKARHAARSFSKNLSVV
jgi:FMN-dependent NADH-azoreductase